jgi:hypothetical protein
LEKSEGRKEDEWKGIMRAIEPEELGEIGLLEPGKAQAAHLI